MALPEVTERISHGAPSFFVRAKNLVATMHVTHDDRLSLWVGVYLDTDVDWDEIAQIVGDSFRCIAPKRLIAELD